MRTILQVEDTDSDVLFLRLAVRQVRPKPRVLTVSDGAEALAYFSGDWAFSDRQKFPMPDLVLLDMNLPALGGLEVLTWIRRQPQFAKLPVIMLTSFADESAADLARRLGANDYVIKPLSVDDLATALRAICSRWLQPGPHRVAPGGSSFAIEPQLLSADERPKPA
jgi:CheY-like chemotaxis protein